MLALVDLRVTLLEEGVANLGISWGSSFKPVVRSHFCLSRARLRRSIEAVSFFPSFSFFYYNDLQQFYVLLL